MNEIFRLGREPTYYESISEHTLQGLIPPYFLELNLWKGIAAKSLCIIWYNFEENFTVDYEGYITVVTEW